MTATTNRIYGLDILRAIAIIYVMHWHNQYFIENYLPYKYYWWLVLDGVDLFFVLSGFLIGGILLRAIHQHDFNKKQLLYFWIRRWFRTLPNYFLVLTGLLLIYKVFRGGFPEQYGEYYFFIQCFNSPHPVFFSEAWSLAVEEWFYLLIPLGLFLIPFKSNKTKAVFYWIAFVLIAVTVYRIYKVSAHHYMEDGTYSLNVRRQVLTRLDSIMYGVLGAYISLHLPRYWNKNRTFFFITGLVIIFGSRIWSSYDRVFYQYWYFSVQAIGILLLLPKLSNLKKGKGPVFRALTFISIISYSMYLLNHRADVVVEALFKKAGIAPSGNAASSIGAYLLSWGVTIVLSYLLYRFFELPVMNFREKFKPKPASGHNSINNKPDISTNFQS